MVMRLFSKLDGHIYRTLCKLNSKLIIYIYIQFFGVMEYLFKEMDNLIQKSGGCTSQLYCGWVQNGPLIAIFLAIMKYLAKQ